MVAASSLGRNRCRLRAADYSPEAFFGGRPRGFLVADEEFSLVARFVDFLPPEPRPRLLAISERRAL
jgi:hypothetical protein